MTKDLIPKIIKATPINSRPPYEVAEFGIRDRILRRIAPKYMLNDHPSLALQTTRRGNVNRGGIKTSLRGSLVRMLFTSIMKYINLLEASSNSNSDKNLQFTTLTHHLALVPHTPSAKSSSSRSLSLLPPLDLPLLFSILYVAFKRLRIPILPADICRWIHSNSIDLSTTIASTPAFMKGVPSRASVMETLNVSNALAAFKRFLKPSNLEHVVTRLGVAGINVGPDLSTYALVPRALHATYLPSRLQPIVCEILSTLEVWACSVQQDCADNDSAIADVIERAIFPSMEGIRVYGLPAKSQIVVDDEEEEEVHSDLEEVVLDQEEEEEERENEKKKKKMISRAERSERRKNLLIQERDNLIQQGAIAYINKGRLFVVKSTMTTPKTNPPRTSSFQKKTTLILQDTSKSSTERSAAYLASQVVSCLKLLPKTVHEGSTSIGKGFWSRVPVHVQSAAVIVIAASLVWEGFHTEGETQTDCIPDDETLKAQNARYKKMLSSTFNEKQLTLISSLPSSAHILLKLVGLIETGGIESRLPSNQRPDAILNLDVWNKLSAVQQELILKSLWIQSTVDKVPSASNETELLSLFMKVIRENEDWKENTKIEIRRLKDFLKEALSARGINVSDDDYSNEYSYAMDNSYSHEEKNGDDDDVNNLDEEDERVEFISESDLFSSESKISQLEWFLLFFKSALTHHMAHLLSEQLPSSSIVSLLSSSPSSFATVTPDGIDSFSAIHTLPMGRALPLVAPPTCQIPALLKSEETNQSTALTSSLRKLMDFSAQSSPPSYAFWVLQLSAFIGSNPSDLHKAVVCLANLLASLWMADKISCKYFERKIVALAKMNVSHDGDEEE
eukprot:GDKJ01064896.1.p1 GENE.GDKJ01064896.1~~GDKJ01064896.1.p1  ORF type:complete len:925 (-),score=278.50 GDKJ01064896.1:71-2611(-)